MSPGITSHITARHKGPQHSEDQKAGDPTFHQHWPRSTACGQQRRARAVAAAAAGPSSHMSAASAAAPEQRFCPSRRRSSPGCPLASSLGTPPARTTASHSGAHRSLAHQPHDYTRPLTHPFHATLLPPPQDYYKAVMAEMMDGTPMHMRGGMGGGRGMGGGGGMHGGGPGAGRSNGFGGEGGAGAEPSNILRLRGLPFSVQKDDIATWFGDLSVTPVGQDK